MNLAETAVLAVTLKLNDQLSGGVAKAEGELAGLNATTKTSGGHLTALAGRAGFASVAVGKFGGALSHAKSAIGGLVTGPLGLIGLSAGLFSLGGLFESSVRHASDMGFAVEKLTGLTGESATSMSTLLVTFEKFGINADKTTQIVGFTEKTLGKLNSTMATHAAAAKSAALQNLELVKAQRQAAGESTKVINKLISEQKGRDKLVALKAQGIAQETKLIALSQQYGVALTDAKGKALPFGAILGHVADFYNSNAAQSAKAALAATLFGRGYAQMIPILKLGSKGIRDAELAAQALGLTLTAQNAKDLKDYRGAIRDVGEAIGGLQLQLGLAFIPTVKDAATALTGFLEHGGRDKIVGFFKDAVAAGRGLATFITGTFIPVVTSIGGKIVDLWNTIPGPIKDLLVKGYVTNRVVKFLFGVDVVGSIGSAIGSAISGALGKAVGSGLVTAGLGKLFVQPVFVTNPGFGMGGGLPVTSAAGAAGAVGVWSKVGTLIGGAFAVVAVAALADMIHSAISPFGGLEGRTNANALLPADQLSWPWGPKNTPRWIIDSPFGKLNLLGGDSSFAAAPGSGGNTSSGFGLGAVLPALLHILRTPALSMDARSGAMRGIVERASRAGFHPTQDAVTATYQRNVLREQHATTKAALATRTALTSNVVNAILSVRNAVLGIQTGSTTNIYSGNTGRGTPMKHPAGTPNVNAATGFNLNVKAVASTRDISASGAIKRRYGPTYTQAGAG